MMQEPRKSVVPVDDCAQIVGFLTGVHQLQALEPRGLAARSMADAAPPHLVEVDTASSPAVVEHTLALDADRRLFGVLSEPEANRVSGHQRTTAVIMLNTAAHPRVGPKPHVRADRAGHRQARPGRIAFRLTGLGDSAGSAEAEGRLYSKVFVSDVVTAMDALAARGFTRFVLVGLCSGRLFGVPLRAGGRSRGQRGDDQSANLRLEGR